MRRSFKSFLFLLVLTVLSGLFLRQIDPVETGTVKGKVRFVVDGDSLFLRGTKAAIRLWGVDAPERDEAGYEAATVALKQLADNRHLTCRRIDTDIYDRIVARCFTGDAREINRLMIEGGTVSEYFYYTLGYYAF